MAEQYSDRVHPETVVLDIGQDIGALIIYTEPELHGREIEVSPRGSAARVHVEVLERRINGRAVFAAVFPGLRAGDYHIWENSANPSGAVTIVGGEVVSVDWRQPTSEARRRGRDWPRPRGARTWIGCRFHMASWRYPPC